jgi:vitamin B12 transporter
MGRRQKGSKSEDLPPITLHFNASGRKPRMEQNDSSVSSLPFLFTPLFIFQFIQMKKEKTISMKVLAACLGLVIPVCWLSAQQTDTTKTRHIKEVVVSASRSEQDPDSVGRSITVISMEQIRNSGANTLAEVLSLQEGIYIVGTGQNPGQLQNLFMRGANSNQTAILIDGVRMTDPSGTDNAIDFSEISLANIERIEIVRGSQSTLYGSSAIGGVINIITRKGMKPGFHGDADLKTGTFGPQTSMFSENLFGNYTHKSGFYVNAGVYHNHTNGMDATVDTTNPNSWASQHRDRDGFDKTDAIGKLGFRNDQLDLFACYKRVHQKTDIDAGAYTDDPAYTVDFTRNLYTWGASYKPMEGASITYTGGATDLTRVAVDDSSIVDAAGNYNHNYYKGTYKGSTMTHEVQANFRTKGLNVVCGAGFFNEKMTANTFFYNTSYGIYESKLNLDSLHISVNTNNEFIHADLDGSIINDRLKVLAISFGARNTEHALFGNNLTWEINPSLKIPGNGLLYACWSTGFNAPSLYQLYDPDQAGGPGSITRGNPTLKPETSASMEFGFKQRLSEQVSFHFSYFKTVVENSIDYVYLWKKNKPVDSLTFNDYQGDTYVNIGTQTNQGFEFGVTTRLSPKFFVSGNVSLVNGKLDYNPATIDTAHTHGNQVQLFANGAFLNNKIQSYGLVRRPSTANISVTYNPFKKLSIGGTVRYVGTRSDVYYNSSLGPNGAQSSIGMGDYTLVDASVRYVIFKGISAGLRVENLFDEKYYEIYGYTTRGRSFYASLTCSF